ncbi:hypothetical protein EDB87DRAFT_1683805 [Lactarius vividus]|nr:hypothetical protein EDB87DRAFT_1683805 [Lactarius vividus]
MENHRITEEERNATFWGGFHMDDCKLMYPRLIANLPHHPKGQPFDYEDVLKVACAEFTNGHFTAFTIDDDWESSFPEESAKPDLIFQWWFGHEAQDLRTSDSDWDDTPCREAYHAAVLRPSRDMGSRGSISHKYQAKTSIVLLL